MGNEDPNNSIVTKKDLEDYFKKLSSIATGVIIVLVIGFLTLLITALSPIIDAWRFRTSTYQSLIDKIDNQGIKIDLLSQTINNNQNNLTILKIEELQKEVNQLKQNE